MESRCLLGYDGMDAVFLPHLNSPSPTRSPPNSQCSKISPGIAFALWFWSPPIHSNASSFGYNGVLLPHFILRGQVKWGPLFFGLLKIFTGVIEPKCGLPKTNCCSFLSYTIVKTPFILFLDYLLFCHLSNITAGRILIFISSLPPSWTPTYVYIYLLPC